MKNVSLTINNNNSYMPPAQVPAAPAFAPVPSKLYAVSFSAQFDTEAEAIKFAAQLLNKVTGDAE